MSNRAIGIDLGTTNSCVAIMEESGGVKVIANEFGQLTTPSYVSFTDTQVIVGNDAKNQAVANADNTVFDAKRLIGRFYNDENVQKDKEHWPFQVVSENNLPKLKVKYEKREMVYSPEQISSMILFKMKTIAEKHLGHSVNKAVVTVPAYFNNSQRQATKDAAQIAGLEVLRIISEPTAAALAYGMRENVQPQNVLVYDLGGGTFDVTVLRIDDQAFDIRATAGDTHLGGEDFNNRFAELAAHKFAELHGGRNLRGNARAMRRLRVACERAKHALSSAEQASIELDSLFEGRDLYFTIQRDEFESICDDLFRSTLVHVQKALADSGFSKTEINEIVLVGGSTRIPKIQQMLCEFFERDHLNRSVNPDEAVAIGAAIQASMLTGRTAMHLRRILDVTPLSLGVALVTGDLSVVIPRNTHIPTSATGDYWTAHPSNQAALIEVRQGEAPLYRDNTLLGEFVLDDLPVTALGENQVDVTFTIDADGILKASAVFRKTNQTNSITISNYSHLAKNEIDRMTREAQTHRQHNNQAREQVEAMQMFERCVLQKRREVRDARLGESQRQQLEVKINEALDWIDNNGRAGRGAIEAQMATFRDFVNEYLEQPTAVTVKRNH